MAFIKWIGLGLVVFGLVWGALLAFGAWRWQGLTAALTAKLEAGRIAVRPARYDEAEIANLPAPVQRYFRAVLTHGQPLIAAATVSHRGTFNMGEVADNWKPFTSSQRVVTARPGFVWDGTVQMLPGVPVRVQDAYAGGTGLLHPAILGLISLVDMRGTGAIADGEFLRFLAETPWYPTALLPSQGAVWTAVDDTSARVTLADGPVSATMTFRFGADGLIASARAEARGRTVGGQIIPTPWEGRWSEYQRRDGITIPMTGEVAWLLPTGDKPYWRGTITALAYDFAE